MLWLITKFSVTALTIVLVSEVAKRTDRIGALIAALPLVTILAMIWLHVEQQPIEKISNHAYYTFWFVLPTIPMFLVMPWLFNKGLSFWPVMGIGAAVTIGCFWLTAVLAKKIGVDLMP